MRLEIEQLQVREQEVEALGEVPRRRALRFVRERPQVGQQMPDEEDRERIRSGENRRREAREQDRDRGKERELHAQERRRLGGRDRERISGQPEDRAEHGDDGERVHGEKQDETRVAADAEGPSRQRLRQRRQDRLALDLARHDADADDDRHQRTRHFHRAQSHVEDDPHPVPDSQLRDEQRSRDEQGGEEQQVVEELAPDQLADRVACDCQERRHQWTSNWLVNPYARSRSVDVERAVPSPSRT